jgi:hypothetical protein
MRTILSAVIVLLALAVGALHLALDFVLFKGNFAGSQASPPPGAPPLPAWPGIAPLPQLFLANFVGYLVLAIIFLAVMRRRAAVRTVVNALLILMTVATLVGWNNIHRPNPNGLGTWAIALELALIAALIVHAITLTRKRG